MRVRGGIFAISLVVTALASIAACSSNDVPSPPVTLADRCRSSCDVPRSSDHPCHTQTTPGTCASTCEATLAGKSDECVTCWLGSAGWRGTTCDCANPGGLGDVACSSCNYRSGSKSCSAQLIDKCASGSTCQGWVPIAIDDPVCASKCGAPVDPATATCREACAIPQNTLDPCSKATDAQVAACMTACLAQTSTATATCQQCYLASSAWRGQACTCSGSSCSLCNWAGRSNASTKACTTPYPCTESARCDGFGQLPAMSDACSQCFGDAGSDAASDASRDASGASDASRDASDGGG